MALLPHGKPGGKKGVTQSCDDMGHCYINIATRKPSSVFMEKAARF